MNNINLTGRLTDTPKLTQTTSGITLTSFSIAVSRPSAHETTDFINCVAWRQTAEFITKYFSKGQKIEISGILTSRKYEDSQKNKRTAYEVVCSQVGFCGDKKDYLPPESMSQKCSVSYTDTEFEELKIDEELPF